jgi:hypothetical protein
LVVVTHDEGNKRHQREQCDEHGEFGGIHNCGRL